MKRISRKQIQSIFLEYYTNQYGKEASKQLWDNLPDCNYAQAVAQAQLESDRNVLRELFETIEKRWGNFEVIYGEEILDIGGISSSEWQALKKKYPKGVI